MVAKEEHNKYVVLARKWRPSQFKDMIGQEHITKILLNSIRSQKVAHGYLFTGTRGVGKTTAARILAKALNCLQTNDGEACGVCHLCQEMLANSCMDIIEIDGASNRGINDIRDLREQIHYSPMKGQYKIYIIDEVHMLTKEAFNALLKTLEEPPSHVIFIFATTEIRKIPQTITSRVQRFDFKPIRQEQISQHLAYIIKEEGLKANKEALELIALRADGSMRDSLSYLDQVLGFEDPVLEVSTVQNVLGIPSNSIFEALFKSLTENNVTLCLQTLRDCFHLGIEPRELLSDIGLFFRNLLFSTQKDMTASILNLSKKQWIYFKHLRSAISDTDLLRYSKGFSDMLQELKVGSPHYQLIIEIGFTKLCHLAHINDLNTLLQKFKNQDLTSQDLTNQDLTSQDLTNQDLTNQDLTSQDLTNQDLKEHNSNNRENTSLADRVVKSTEEPLKYQSSKTETETENPPKLSNIDYLEQKFQRKDLEK